jgi:alcohol dehydrogenase (cytochrome c)
MKSTVRNALIWTGAAVATAAGIGLALAQSPGSFTAAQAARGKAVYQANCVGCHQPDLAGQGDALPLAGPGFMLGWSGRSTAELYKQIHETMPYGMGGSLSAANYADVTAFILSANGAQPGPTEFSPASTTRIGAIAGRAPASDQAASAPAKTEATANAPAAPQAAAAPAAAARGDGEGTALKIQAAGWTMPGEIKTYSDVTDEMLRNPADADWLMYRGGYAGWSYSKLNQVNAGNVQQLKLVWSWSMTAGSTQETTPLIHDGIMFLWNPGNVIQALDAATGDLLWENRLGPAPTRAFGAGADGNRTIAIYKDKVFIATHEARLYALDARSGKTVWQAEIGDPSTNFGQTTAGPIVINGKVVSGLTSCGASGAPANAKAHCYISAYDAETGKRVWEFSTVGLNSQPGGETWNGVPDNKRAGGETWILGTYDPKLNTMYWGTAQAKPWRRDLRGTGDGEVLYTSSTLALNPDTGALKWHFSHAPGETLDLDEVFERTLIDEGDKKVLVTVGKPGILWKLDRETGKFIQSTQTIVNNVSKVDPTTGKLTMRTDIANQKLEDWLASCPGPQGGHDWMPTSFHQPSHTLIVPLSQSCVEMLGNGAQKFYFMPGSDGNLARLSAFDTTTFEPKWTFQQRSPFMTGVLSTAGDVAFIGDYDRRFSAIDVATGKTLWETRLGTSVQGHPVSFSVNGKQYIAVTTGLGGGSPQQKPMALLPDVARPMQGNQLYVFALPDRHS